MAGFNFDSPEGAGAASAKKVVASTKRSRSGPNPKKGVKGKRTPKKEPVDVRQDRRESGRAEFEDTEPHAEYGRLTMSSRRGTPSSIARYGRNAWVADSQQSENRGHDQFAGQGRYRSQIGNSSTVFSTHPIGYTGRTGDVAFTGSGSYWNHLWGGVKKLAHGVSSVAAAAGPAFAAALPVNPLVKMAVSAGMKYGLPMVMKAIGSGKYVFPPDHASAFMGLMNQHPEIPGSMLLLAAKQNGIQTIGGLEELAYKMYAAANEPDISFAAYGPGGTETAAPPNDRGELMDVAYNSLIDPGSNRTDNGGPHVETADDGSGDLIVTHMEFLKDLKSTGVNFHTMAKVQINPGLKESFPVLANFAQFFEEYTFIQLVLAFDSTLTESNAAAAGTIMISPVYNASSIVAQGKGDIENNGQTVTAVVSGRSFAGFECDELKNRDKDDMYVRGTEVSLDQRKLFDVGYFQVASTGIPADLNVGSLRIAYKVRLSKLRIQSNIPVSLGSGVTASFNAGTSTVVAEYADSFTFGLGIDTDGPVQNPGVINPTVNYSNEMCPFIVDPLITNFNVTTNVENDRKISNFKCNIPVRSGTAWVVRWSTTMDFLGSYPDISLGSGSPNSPAALTDLSTCELPYTVTERLSLIKTDLNTVAGVGGYTKSGVFMAEWLLIIPSTTSMQSGVLHFNAALLDRTKDIQVVTGGCAHSGGSQFSITRVDSNTQTFGPVAQMIAAI